jgi:hypothetical protein
MSKISGYFWSIYPGFTLDHFVQVYSFFQLGNNYLNFEPKTKYYYHYATITKLLWNGHSRHSELQSEHEISVHVALGLVKPCTYTLSIVQVNNGTLGSENTNDIQKLVKHSVVFTLTSNGIH